MEEDKSGTIRNKVDHKCDEPRKLSHQFIEQITKDFNEALIVGSGAFGTVYKGVCENGEQMAVKKLHNMSFDSKEFEREFENLRRLKHKNVVQLKGFCNESEEVLVEYQMRQVIAEKMHTALCFEFVRNGSLARHISDDGSSRLNWHIQFEIIKGICDGLEYLRHGLEFSVWHLDLKPDNILLDENMIPKIVDFGLSRLLGDENTRKTINKNGTCGYMPPEYIEHGLVTKEFDIFSLGVIIAKLMAGHEGYSKIDEMTEHKFAKKVHDKWRKILQETLAPRPLEVYCEQVKMCIQIALKCMKRNRQERPTIKSIVSHLRETEVLIGKLGLPRERQFHEGESTLSEGGIQVGTPNYDSISAISSSPDNEEMAAESSRRKTNDSKMGTASAERKKLPLQLLKKITNDFSEERIIGTAEYGIVYKGILEDGEIIAVTRLDGEFPHRNKSAFLNEVQKVTILKHENALQLVGFCRERHQIVVEHNGRYITADPNVNLLCYEYLPRGSLQKNLFEVPNKMDWEIRFKIIKGICQGLLFQHRIDIPHLHLTPEDILLDNNMRPKIADYLRGFFIPQTTRWNVSARFPWGYIAPECLYRGEFSTKSDIYGLGLLIMETSTGERNLATRKHDVCGLEFIKCVRDNWTEERIASEYPSLDAVFLNQIKACINIGLECVETDRHKRPSLETIVDMLKELSQITSDGLLSLQPGRINFPFGPKRLSSSSVYLVNNRDDRIAFRLETKFPRRYLTKLPFCGIVPPKCTYTLTVIAREQRKPPPSSSDDCLTLQSSTAHHEDLDNVDPASVGVFLDAAGDEVQEEKVEVACEPLANTISNDQVIDGPNYREVLSVDVHPTEPWILISNKRGHVCIWNYQTQAEMNSTEVTREPVYAVKFIEREGWFVAGSGDGCIYVYDYNTMEEVDMIEEAHESHRIMSVAVNPTHSLLLSASDDHKIKLWDWTNGWHCIRTYEGHDDTVTQVMFNPRNSESFASASLDHTVKIWNIHSATCNITWDGHPDGLLSVHYHPRYFQQSLISGSSDGAAKIWDLETDSCVDMLQGHEKGISALCWHPELRALVTGSLDGTVRILSWMCHSNTYRLENIIGLNLGAVNALGYLKGLTRIVVGCDQGMALMEIGMI